jgi:hypothetical protein
MISIALLVSIVSMCAADMDMDWYDVSAEHITAKSESGVSSNYYNDGSGHLVIEADIENRGCGGPESHIFAFISDSVDGDELTRWTRIRYTMSFAGSSSCWSILGDTVYGDWPSNLQHTGLYEFNPKRVPAVRNPDILIANNLKYGSWDGESVACDNEASNFWHPQHGSGDKGSIRVEQTRDIRRFFHAGIGSGHSCSDVGTTKVTYSDIQVGFAIA